MPNEVHVVFQDSLYYDYNFIIKLLAGNFEEKIEFWGKNTEKYKTFFIPLEQ